MATSKPMLKGLALRAYCASIGVDPHKFMADMLADTSEVVLGVDSEGHTIMGPAVKPELKFHAAKELAQYLEPKLKAMDLEVSGPGGGPIPYADMTPAERDARIRELMAKFHGHGTP